MTRRQYSNTATEATLTSAVAAADTSIILTSFADYPPAPFTATISRGEVDEEVVLATAVSGSTLTVTRGYDGTTSKAHSAGATFLHTTVAKDFDEANAHVNTAVGVHGVVSSLVGTTDTQTLTNKTLTTPTISGPTITGTTAAASATLSGTLSVAGATALAAATLSGALNVTGATHLSSDLTVAGNVVLGPITFAVGQVGTFAAVTGTTGTFTGALKGSSLESTSQVVLTQIATPSAPANGKSNLYVASADDRLYWQSDAAGVVKTPTVHQGSGTAYPSSPAEGDTFRRTDLGYTARWNGTLWIPQGEIAVFGKMWRTTGFSTSFSNGSSNTVILDGHREFGGFTYAGSPLYRETLPLDGFYEVTARNYASGGAAGSAQTTVHRARSAVADAQILAVFDDKTATSDASSVGTAILPLKAGDAIWLTFEVTGGPMAYYGNAEWFGSMLSARWVGPLNGVTPI